MEKKISSDKANQIIKKFNYPFSLIFLPMVCREGGRGLVWKNSPNTVHKILSSSNRFIYCRIKDNIKHTSRLSTFNNGFPHHHLPKSLWKQHGNLTNRDNNPWLIIGDLNGYPVLIRDCLRIKAIELRHNNFSRFIQKNNLIDLGFTENRCTWHDKRENLATVFSLLTALWQTISR